MRIVTSGYYSCVIAFSAIFQLDWGSQFYWRKPEGHQNDEDAQM
jgi:hypothetical protein